MAPKTLTRQEFLQRRPGGNYKRYRSYVTRKRAQRNAWRSDPFAQIPERHIQQTARQDVMPSIRAQQQAIEEAIERRSRSGVGQIRGFTDSLMSALSPYDARIAGYYGDAMSSGVAIGDALRSALAGGGGQAASELGGKLAAINAPEALVEQVAGGAARTGTGSAGATFGMSAADLERLGGERAAHGAYAAKQPGIAALSGLQSARALELALSGQLADQVGELRASAPGLISERVGQLRETNFDRALANETRRSEAAQLRQQYAEMRAEAQTDAEKAAVDRWYKQQQIAIRQGQLSVSQQNANTSKQRAATAARKAETSGHGDRADYFYDVREDAFAEAKKYAKPGRNQYNTPIKPLTREDARQRLWQEFGRALVGRGFPRSKAMQLIEAALSAAGYRR